MRAIGLDIGTTTICAVVVDGSTGTIIDSITVNNDSSLTGLRHWEKLQEPSVIYGKAKDLVDELAQKHAPIECIGVTGQMHGILYIDGKGDAVSPLYTWQDGRGDILFKDGKTYSEYLSEKTTYKLASGYGAVTHFYNLNNFLVPASAKLFCTIHDYVAMKLAGRTTPVMNPTNAASMGLFDMNTGAFDYAAIHKSGMNKAFFPAVTQGAEILGTNDVGIPVTVAIGDNQASFIGSVKEPGKSILVNVGTGSQISLYIEQPVKCTQVETRPFAEEGFLLVGAPLCGGRAYALLEGFFENVIRMAGVEAADNLYMRMETAAEDLLSQKDELVRQDMLEISTEFNGTRDNPLLRGSIGNLGIDNFTPQHFIAGVLEGIANELQDLYENMAPVLENSPSTLVGSGNGIRKNKLLQKIFSEKFKMPLQIPIYNEEAAYGAALFAMTGVRYFKDISEAQTIIKYI